MSAHEVVVMSDIVEDLATEAGKLKAENAELAEALARVTELLLDPGVGDLDQWKRDCREWTSKSMKALSKRMSR